MKFSSEELIEDINNKLYLEPLLFLTNKTNPFKLKERKFPIDFVNPWQDKNVVSIQIPEGYKVESIPTATAISMTSNIGVFKFQASQVGNKIKVNIVDKNIPPTITAAKPPTIVKLVATKSSNKTEAHSSQPVNCENSSPPT